MNFELIPSEAPPPPHFNVGFRNFARTTSQRHYTSTLKKGGGRDALASALPTLSKMFLRTCYHGYGVRLNEHMNKNVNV